MFLQSFELQQTIIIDYYEYYNELWMKQKKVILC